MSLLPCQSQSLGPPYSPADTHIWAPVSTGHEATPAGAWSKPAEQAPRLYMGDSVPEGPALHLLSKFDRVAGEPGPKVGVQVESRGNLNHFLVPPLDGTVSLIQVQNVPVLVPWGGR